MDTQRLITSDALAERLQCSKGHIENLRRRRLIPFVQLGRLVRFDERTVQAALEKLTVTAR